jgi:hypothetical protein
MPVFNALAGLSPSCCAVLVQMEHWATLSLVADNKKATNRVSIHLFMIRTFEQRYNQAVIYGLVVESSPKFEFFYLKQLNLL